MPSYLSSTQTSGPRRVRISAASSAGEASMNLSGWNSASSAEPEPVLAREHGRLADVAGEHPRPLHVVERPLERLRDRRLEQPLAQADPQLAGQDLDDVLRRQRVGPREQRAEDRALARRPRRRLDRGERVGDLGHASGPASGAGCSARSSSTSSTARPRSDDRSYASPSAPAGHAREVGDGGRDRGPAEARRPLVGLGERPSGEEPRGRAELVGGKGSKVVGQQRRLLGGARGGGDPLRELAPAVHGGDGIPSPA